MNGSPCAPWNNEPDRSDPFKPWNDPMYKDDPFAPWNDSAYSDEDDYEKWCDENHISEIDR
jgi:hypothetical protein